jgi:hypothetical protein
MRKRVLTRIIAAVVLVACGLLSALLWLSLAVRGKIILAIPLVYLIAVMI